MTLFWSSFGRSFLNFLFERSKKIWKKAPLLWACAVGITLETQKGRKRAPRFVEFNFFTNRNRRKRFCRMKEEGQIYKMCLNIFTFCLGTKLGHNDQFLCFSSGFNEPTYARVRNKKQSPQNKHERPYTHTCSSFLIVIRWHYFLLVFTICYCALEIRMSSGMVWSEKKREFFFFFGSHPPDVGVKNYQRAGTPGSGLHGPNIWQKRTGQKCFFFTCPLKINARGGRETEKLIIVPLWSFKF